MATLDELVRQAGELPPGDRERLVQALGGERPAFAQLGSLAARPPAPQSAAWVKAERGHAVLATDSGVADAHVPAGPDAIAGMWADAQGAQP